MKVRTSSAIELAECARAFMSTLIPAAKAAVLVTLSGELGAGKTTFSQAVALALGVQETVTSPTIVIEKIYPLEGQKWQRLVHIDAYRLTGAKDLEALHWDELIADSGNIILLEWPEKVAEAIPASAHALRFDIDGDTRIIVGIHGKEN